MSKYIFNTLCAVVVGLIVLAFGFLLSQKGFYISTEKVVVWAFGAAIAVWVMLMPKVFKKLRHICNDYDWADEVVKLYQGISPKYRQSFWLLFGFINLAFLFHTINFMWGGADWAAVRHTVDHHEAISAGSFSAYWLQELLFDGKILPVINNLWSFAGLALAGVLLAIYWNMPERATVIVTVGLLFAVTPYTLAILYFAKTSLGVCFAPALVLAALLIADRKHKTASHTYLCNTASVLLLLWALGTYMPVVSFMFLAVIGRIFIKTVYADISFKDAFSRSLQGFVNILTAVMFYIFILFVLEEANYLDDVHARALGVATPFLRLGAVIKYAFLQFGQPLPFMDVAYKLLYLALSIMALFTLILYAPNAKASLRGLILIPVLLVVSLLALLFVTEPQAHFVRLTFFGLPFLYALAFLSILLLGTKTLRRIAYGLAFLLIFMNFVRISYAEKVWKFGWDAETKLAERIITRLEKQPEFNIERQYKLLQVGEKSLRSKYYKAQADEAKNGELLSYAYYPAGKAKDAYNFFYQTDFLAGDAADEALHEPVIADYLLNRAKAWPAKEAIFIYGDYIVLVLDEKALADIQRKIP